MAPSKLEQLTNAFLELLEEEDIKPEECSDIETTPSGMFFDYRGKTYNVNLWECDPSEKE